MKCIDLAFYFSRLIHTFPLHVFTSVSPGQQSSHTWRHTTSIMKDRIFSSGTEKCVFPAFLVAVCIFLLYCWSCWAELSYCLIVPSISFVCRAVFWWQLCALTGRGGADLRGLVEYLLGSSTTNQASDAGRPRAYPSTTLLHVLALGL